MSNEGKIITAVFLTVFVFSVVDRLERTDAPINADIRLNTLEKE